MGRRRRPATAGLADHRAADQLDLAARSRHVGRGGQQERHRAGGQRGERRRPGVGATAQPGDRDRHRLLDADRSGRVQHRRPHPVRGLGGRGHRDARLHRADQPRHYGRGSGHPGERHQRDRRDRGRRPGLGHRRGQPQARLLRRSGHRPGPGPVPAARTRPGQPAGLLGSVPVLPEPRRTRLLPDAHVSSRRLPGLTTGSVHLCPFSLFVFGTWRGARGERCPARRDRRGLWHGGQGGRPSRADAAAPGLFRLPVQPGRSVPADPASRIQADLARRLDQHLLRAPAAR